MPGKCLPGRLKEVADELVVDDVGAQSQRRGRSRRLALQGRRRHQDTQATPMGGRTEDVLHELDVTIEGEVLVETKVREDTSLASESLPDCLERCLGGTEVQAAQGMHLRQVVELVGEVAAGVNDDPSELFRELVDVGQGEFAVELGLRTAAQSSLMLMPMPSGSHTGG